MLDYSVKIGLAPLRRDVTPRPGIFNWEKAEERGRRLTAYIEKTFTGQRRILCGCKRHHPGGCTDNGKRTPKGAAERFRQEQVDALLMINVISANEEAGALLARELGKPVLIWAPLDDEFEEDGTRYTDSQCGLFGLSRMLQRLNIPFSYIETLPGGDGNLCPRPAKICVGGLYGKEFSRPADSPGGDAAQALLLRYLQ